MNKKVINILGYGITNMAIVEFLNKNNIKCVIYDDKFIESYSDDFNVYRSFRGLASFNPPNPDYSDYPNYSGSDSGSNSSLDSNFENLTIISPGIPPYMPELVYFCNIISEYDFFYSLLNRLKKNIFSIWISGTNGKTTTTEMTALMLGVKSGGNIGTPLAKLFMQDFCGKEFNFEDFSFEDFSLKDRLHGANLTGRVKSHDLSHLKSHITPFNVTNFPSIAPDCATWILETSSFSLHYSNFALPNVYILLPLSEDHISWHGSFEAYVRDKLKPLVLMNLAKNTQNHFVVIPKELEKLEFAHEILISFKGNMLLYETSSDLIEFLCSKKYHIENLSEYTKLFKEPFLLDFLLSIAGMRFANVEFNLNPIKNYKIGNYRMQEIKKNGILFVNDSKGTNPNAVLAALNTYRNYAIYIILGGDSKGADLCVLYSFLRENAVKVFSIGRDGAKIARDCRADGIFAMECGILRLAMERIYAEIKKDYSGSKDSKELVVMLSPACASLDQYESYRDRGEEFNRLIKDIF